MSEIGLEIPNIKDFKDILNYIPKTTCFPVMDILNVMGENFDEHIYGEQLIKYFQTSFSKRKSILNSISLEITGMKLQKCLYNYIYFD